jgi:DNA-dependent metalloprotease WSS1
MKNNYIAVMALEEHKWNTEFAGRNFNAGEVIQLVLRGRSGHWLPFRHVQMVMMHELAHCKEMNHSKDFWKVRNGYAEEMRGLWGRGYTGDGLWGRGRAVTEQFVESTTVEEGDLPEHTCGGTFRSGGRKRKRGAGKPDGRTTMSYAERMQKRMLRKFGTGGVKLGDDEDTRVKLEEGKKPKGKPRVAKSARGRELRAAAALARFEKVKEEGIKKEEEVTDSETDSEYDWPPSDDETAAVDENGKKILDAQGHGMVRICEAEDEDDDDVKRELEEMRMADIPKASSVDKKPPKQQGINNGSTTESGDEAGDAVTKPIPAAADTRLPKKDSGTSTLERSARPPIMPKPKAKSTLNFKPSNIQAKPRPASSSKAPISISSSPSQPQSAASTSTCPACSLLNPPGALTCITCSNVLNPALMPNCWRCESEVCKGGAFVNSADYGRCVVCGEGRD